MTAPRPGSIDLGDEAVRSAASPGRGAVMLLFAVCLAIALLPLLAVKYPPLLDYPNHLARVHILAHPDDPHLSDYWQADWSLLPNLGFDLIALALVQFMPVEVAGRVFLGLGFAVVLGAPLALHRALYGRLSPLPLVAGALIFNRVLQMGFLGYFLGFGLAIWSFAGWIVWRRRPLGTRLALMQGTALLLFFCHLYAMAVLAVAVALSAAWAGWRAASGTLASRLGGAARSALVEVLPFVLPLVLLVAASETGGAGPGATYEAPHLKLLMLPLALLPQLTVLGLLLIAVVLVTPLIARLGGGRMIHPAAAWPAAGMLTLYMAMPYNLLSSENADWRLLAPLAVIVVGAVEDPFRGRRGRAGVALLAVLVNVTAAWNAWGFWRGADGILADFRAATAPIERGALLVPWIPGDPGYRKAYGPPSVLHMPALAVIEDAALVPTVFAIEGQQPIALRQPYRVARAWHFWLEQPSGAAPPIEALVMPGRYVLEIRAGPTPAPALPVNGEPVTRAGIFTLWRLERRE